jgi:DNA-binding MarR family transcriptional regulator
MATGSTATTSAIASSRAPGPGDDGDLAARLRLVVGRLERRLRQQTGEVTASQFSALSTVARMGPITIGDLSAAERVQPPSMTRIVAALEDFGLIERQVDAKDRRVARVHVTPRGEQLLERTRSRKNAYLTVRLGQLTPAERSVLAEAAPLLERLLEGEA